MLSIRYPLLLVPLGFPKLPEERLLTYLHMDALGKPCEIGPSWGTIRHPSYRYLGSVSASRHLPD